MVVKHLINIGVLAFIISILTLLYRMTSHADISTRERQARMDFVRSQLGNRFIESPDFYFTSLSHFETLIR